MDISIESHLMVGIVVIGRNEGERLRSCLASISQDQSVIVYVDSGSTDNSITIAQEYGVRIIDLDMSIPFSAARARNAGVEVLNGIDDSIKFVQFIDGDCELISGWLAKAVNELVDNPKVGIVAGHINEKHPLDSIYNRLAELEWNFHGIGEVDAVGGIFMIRRSAFDAVGGFNSTVKAGEEPELCQRLREQHWKILRLNLSMASHDLGMTKFSQWWTRQVRTGYGGLDVAIRFGISNFEKNNLRARFWSGWLLAVIVFIGLGLMLDMPRGFYLGGKIVVSLWFFQLLRIALREFLNNRSICVSSAYAWFTMLSFWPQMIGQVRYLIDMRKNKGLATIEYRSASDSIVDTNSEGRQ